MLEITEVRFTEMPANDSLNENENWRIPTHTKQCNIASKIHSYGTECQVPVPLVEKHFDGETSVPEEEKDHEHSLVYSNPTSSFNAV
jgi:hypothetical protein